MNPKSSNNLHKSLLIVGCGAVPLTAFLFQATPILLVTVTLSLLTLFTVLLLFLSLIAIVAGLIIGIGWIWTMFDDDRDQRRYWRVRRRLDLEQHRPITTHSSKSRYRSNHTCSDSTTTYTVTTTE